MKHIIVTGAASGLGKAIVDVLDPNIFFVIPVDIDEMDHPNYIQTDIRDERSIAHLVSLLMTHGVNADIIINCAGINYINWLQNTPTEAWEDVMDTNAKSIFLMSKYFYQTLLKTKGTILNIVSNAAHIPMTNSIAYNASKGAAWIMTEQLSRELAPQGITVFGIAPNKIANTAMSQYIDSTVCGLRGWTPEEATAYQLKSLPTGEETPAELIAEFINFILSTKERHKFMAGTIIPYGR